MKAIDLYDKLTPAQRVSVQGDVSESYAVNWWETMVRDANSLGNVEGSDYKHYREQCDNIVIDIMISNGADPSEHKTKNGRYIIGSMFANPKAYNNYRSNKSIIAKALDAGIPLLSSDGQPIAKSEVQRQIKATVATDKALASPYERAMKYARLLGEVMPALTDSERDTVLSAVCEV